MQRSINLTKTEFESSSMRTPAYLSWHRLFKREFTAFLRSKGADEIKIGKPNHFDIYGFFRIKGQIWYFSIGDLRWSKDSMLVRTAESFEDYTGGTNCDISLKNISEFTEQFTAIVR